MEVLIDGINYLVTFFGEINSWLESVFIELSSWVVVWYINAKIYAIQVAWSIAQSVLANTNISALIKNAWSGLDSTLVGYLTFFRLPEAINIMLQAHVTRFSMRLLGL